MVASQKSSLSTYYQGERPTQQNPHSKSIRQIIEDAIDRSHLTRQRDGKDTQTYSIDRSELHALVEKQSAPKKPILPGKFKEDEQVISSLPVIEVPETTIQQELPDLDPFAFSPIADEIRAFEAASEPVSPFVEDDVTYEGWIVENAISWSQRVRNWRRDTGLIVQDLREAGGQRIIMHVSNARAVKLFTILFICIILSAKLFEVFNDDRFIVLYGIMVTCAVFLTFSVTYLAYRDPYDLAVEKAATGHPDMQKMPRISCMVAVFNEEVIVEQCIRSMSAQTYPNLEIILVNDCSTDNTKQVLDRCAKIYPIRVIHLEKNVGKKRALGRAMLEADGEIFAFSDSDSIWAPDAIEKIAMVLNYDKDIGAVSGHCRALNANKNLVTKVQDTWYEGQFSVRKAYESVFGAVTCVSGPLAVFRRSAVYNYIPAWENDSFLGQEFRFATDRTLTGFVLGSRAIGPRLKEKYADSPFVQNEDYKPQDWKVVYCKAARSWTEVPDTARRVLKQQIRWKKSFIRNVFFTGAFYWEKPILAALIYYLHILFVFMGPFITFKHLIVLPLQGNLINTIIYLLGIVFVGTCFGLAFKLENQDSSKWILRPIMSIASTLFLSFVVYYSMFTIKKMIWARG